MTDLLSMLLHPSKLDNGKFIYRVLEVYGDDSKLKYSSLTEELHNSLSKDLTEQSFELQTIGEKIKDCLDSKDIIQISSDDYRVLVKFCDHILLETARKNQYIQQTNELQRRIQTLHAKLETKHEEHEAKIEYKVKEINNDLENKSKQLENNLSTNIITVLGVFAAFITAFIGGIGAFSSIMQSINKGNIFRLLFIVFLFGLIYFDTCFSLTYSISRMLGKTIASSSYEPNSNNGFWKEIRLRVKRYPIFCLFNSIMIIGMMLTIVAFYMHKNGII